MHTAFTRVNAVFAHATFVLVILLAANYFSSRHLAKQPAELGFKLTQAEVASMTGASNDDVARLYFTFHGGTSTNMIILFPSFFMSHSFDRRRRRAGAKK
jgi:hypothetical protein